MLAPGVNAPPCRSVLVVQKNNIGDLVLATPFLRELRRRMPQARIDVLCNSYNATVLDGNRDVDRVFVHAKRKHYAGRTGIVRRCLAACAQTWRMRQAHYDDVFLLSGRFSPRYALTARLVAPARVVGFSDGADARARAILDVAVEGDAIAARHVVERSLHLLWAAFPAMPAVPAHPRTHPCRVFPDRNLRNQVRGELLTRGWRRDRPTIGLQISARRPRQRWPLKNFAALARAINVRLRMNCLILWAPGNPLQPTHPGDDARADALDAMCRGFVALRYRTPRLADLIAAFALADVVVSADGGAMHLAAACGKPVVALFGDSDPSIWHPWSDSFALIRSDARDVASVEPERVLGELSKLLEICNAGT